MTARQKDPAQQTRKKAAEAPLADVPAFPHALLSWRALPSLIPYARNARVHSTAQIAQLAASIEEFGFAAPILADERGIVAGHGRVLAALQLQEAGHTLRLPSGHELPGGMVPVVDCSGWSDAKRRAYVLADNRLAENAGWDHALLAEELRELQGEEFDVNVLGFTEQELVDLLGIANFTPGSAGQQGQLDAPKQVTCPQCGHVFAPSYGEQLPQATTP